MNLYCCFLGSFVTVVNLSQSVKFILYSHPWLFFAAKLNEDWLCWEYMAAECTCASDYDILANFFLIAKEK